MHNNLYTEYIIDTNISVPMRQMGNEINKTFNCLLSDNWSESTTGYAYHQMTI